ncbi:DUF4307 domain-containing protein [Microbispora sp. RL4-1S]|uniref:DUF4307 domain-containing protein n=1 Tax=Microbispora oryzae TaxID=2806554 RepID=A0A940WLI4_9ACTN|nr:DUF4307 domain-containing protein [Microbispora oryzae]MBP2707153.1 DUF4307 domain-containing protein [Microbispora oryzae]
MASDQASEGGQTPVLGTPDDFAERPAGRGTRVAYVVIGLLVALMGGGWGYVMLAANGNPVVNGQVITYDAAAADHADVTFTVHKPSGRAATCRLRALDTRHLEVGSRDIAVPAAGSDVRLDERVRTSAQATTVQVDYCDLV